MKHILRRVRALPLMLVLRFALAAVLTLAGLGNAIALVAVATDRGAGLLVMAVALVAALSFLAAAWVLPTGTARRTA